MQPLGSIYSLPSGYSPLDFIQSSGTQYINTNYIPGNETGIYCEHEYRVAEDSIVFGCRTTGSTETRFYCPRGVRSYENNASDGYGWGGWATMWDSQLTVRTRVNGSLNWLNSRHARHPRYLEKLQSLSFSPNCPLYLFAADIGHKMSLAASARIWYAGISEGNHIVRNFVPAIAPSGEPCMFCTVSGNAFFNSGNGNTLIAGVRSPVQLYRLLAALPATGGTLRLSLPAEANNPEITTLLNSTAAEKHWTLIVYEYRSPSISIYNRRRTREFIWYRREPCEGGSYSDSSGTHWQIEQLAALFTPNANEPSELGYEAFGAVDEALVRWGLTLGKPRAF